jgi:acetylornithine deacetylase/succinyl-diaminopimelate desuccinylase-like protein
MESVLKAEFPAAGVVPAVAGGFTDSHFFRDLGIASYGFSPMLLSEEVMATAHGNNERVHIEDFRRGVRIMRELVAKFIGRPNDVGEQDEN